MAGDTFGVETAELAKIEKDWHSVSRRMAELNKRLGEIKETLVTAASIDLATAPLAALPGFGIAYQVLADVKDIAEVSGRLEENKKKLLEELAGDAGKIKKVKAEYEANEKKIEDELKKIKDRKKDHDAPTPPDTPAAAARAAATAGPPVEAAVAVAVAPPAAGPARPPRRGTATASGTPRATGTPGRRASTTRPPVRASRPRPTPPASPASARTSSTAPWSG